MRPIPTALLIETSTKKTIKSLRKSGFRTVEGDELKGSALNPFYTSNQFLLLVNDQLSCGVAVSKKLGKQVLSFAVVI